jgi:hypothetical protein
MAESLIVIASPPKAGVAISSFDIKNLSLRGFCGAEASQSQNEIASLSLAMTKMSLRSSQ